MDVELAEYLGLAPDEFAKRILKDVFQKGRMTPWISLRAVKETAEKSERNDGTILTEYLGQILAEMALRKPHHAQILQAIYWQKKQTKAVAWSFNETHNYAQSSGTFFKWLKEARHDFGLSVLQQEETGAELDGVAEPTSKTLAHETSTVEFSAIKPLDPEQRRQILSAKTVCASGITLFRLLPAFQYEFCEMLRQGGRLRVLLASPCGASMQMAGLRSNSDTPADVQRRRVEDMIELLARWRQNIPHALVDMRTLDYFPAYGITIIEPNDAERAASCQVRHFPFRRSTSIAPSATLDYSADPHWFAYFADQFEQMWLAGDDCLALTNSNSPISTSRTK